MPLSEVIDHIADYVNQYGSRARFAKVLHCLIQGLNYRAKDISKSYKVDDQELPCFFRRWSINLWVRGLKRNSGYTSPEGE